MKRILVVVLVAAALSAPLAVAASRGLFGGPSAAVPDPPRSTFSHPQARAFQAFPLYDLGPEHAGHPLVALLRRSDRYGSPDERVRADYVSFVYGDCTPGPHGCAPPLEVQVWPACVRNPSVLSFVGLPEPERLRVRGVPALYVDEGGGGRLELTTGHSTVVVFGGSRADLLAAASALRGVNHAVGPRSPLPPPAAGALEGDLACE